MSLAALENYLLQHGRDWERYAWVKARVVNSWDDTESLYQEVLRPFVYRRYLDYGVFRALRSMKALIQAEVAKKEFLPNLKLGPGGIREVEFIVQALQLVRGGTVVTLQERQLMKALPALVEAGCLGQRRPPSCWRLTVFCVSQKIDCRHCMTSRPMTCRQTRKIRRVWLSPWAVQSGLNL